MNDHTLAEFLYGTNYQIFFFPKQALDEDWSHYREAYFLLTGFVLFLG